jgi:hypothetical protein
MVAGRVSYKCYLRSTFAHADSGGFEKPPLRKHKRWAHCFMDEIVKLYNEHLTTPFPDRRGDEILGIDLVLIDSDTAGLITKFISYRGQLSINDIRILNHCYSDLSRIVKELSSTDRQYFAQLQNIVGLIIEKLKDGSLTVDNKFKPEWETRFLQIREILNDWDPIGVADMVDDEYDTMNFRTLSVIMNKRDKKEIRDILDDYTKNSMEIQLTMTPWTKLRIGFQKLVWTKNNAPQQNASAIAR